MLRFADPLGVLLFVPLQCEVVEHLAARQELLLLDELEGALGEKHGSESGARLVELRARLQVLVGVGREKAVE